MRQISTNELKRIQIEILDVIAAFCTEHNISYWIDCGTLLGAIRHKGYIPWDDDIDVGMLRPDYEKFIATFNEHNTRYKAVCFENDSSFFVPFVKVMDTETVLYEPDERGLKTCINVDIFTYDNAPADARAVNEMFRWRNILHVCNLARQARIFQLPKGGLARRLCVYALRTMVRVFPRNYFVRKMIENSKRYVNMQTERVGNFLSVARMTCSKRVFNAFTEGEFEGKQYRIPAGYDEYLREFYGDYMQLPPPEKRVSTHVFKAFVKD